MQTGDLVLVRDHDNSEWNLSIYAYEDEAAGQSGLNRFKTINGTTWRYCIPYNGNENLLGTRGIEADFKSGQPVFVRNSEDEEWKIRYWLHSVEGIRHCTTKQLVSAERIAANPESLNSYEKEIWSECQPIENVLGKPFLDIYKKYA